MSSSHKSTVEDLLKRLQIKTIKDLIAKIDSGEADDKLLAVCARLLKDNKITCEIEEGSPIEALTETLGKDDQDWLSNFSKIG